MGATGERQPTTRLVLVRHAVTEETGKTLSGQMPGIELSEDGRAQAKAVAERLAGLAVAAVYSSPLERTRQTAEAVAAPHGHEVRLVDGLLDEDVGDWTGRTLKELAKDDLWRVIMAAPSRVVFPGGEALPAMQARAVVALDALVAAHPGDVVVAVTHADIVKAAVAHYVGLHFDLFQRLVVSPASITTLAFTGPFPALLTFNDTGSLEGLAPVEDTPPEAAAP